MGLLNTLAETLAKNCQYYLPGIFGDAAATLPTEAAPQRNTPRIPRSPSENTLQEKENTPSLTNASSAPENLASIINIDVRSELQSLSDKNLIQFRDFCQRYRLDDKITLEVITTLNQLNIQKAFTTAIRNFFGEQEVILLDNAGAAAGKISISIHNSQKLTITIHGEFPDRFDERSDTYRSPYPVEYLEKHTISVEGRGRLKKTARVKAIDHSQQRIYTAEKTPQGLGLLQTTEPYKNKTKKTEQTTPPSSPPKPSLSRVSSWKVTPQKQIGKTPLDLLIEPTEQDITRIGWEVRALDPNGKVIETIQIGATHLNLTEAEKTTAKEETPTRLLPPKLRCAIQLFAKPAATTPPKHFATLTIRDSDESDSDEEVDTTLNPGLDGKFAHFRLGGNDTDTDNEDAEEEGPAFHSCENSSNLASMACK